MNQNVVCVTLFLLFNIYCSVSINSAELAQSFQPILLSNPDFLLFLFLQTFTFCTPILSFCITTAEKMGLNGRHERQDIL